MDTQEKQFYDLAFSRIESDALQVLKDLGRLEEASIDNAINTDMDFHDDHWISSIEVKLGPASIYLKAHYHSKAVRTLVSRRFGEKSRDFPISILPGFMEEYLNVLMGSLKTSFNTQYKETSTPTTTPSYDILKFFNKDPELNSKRWTISFDGKKIAISAFAMVNGDVEGLNQYEAEAPQSEKMDFF